MTDRIKLVQGDNGPYITFTLKYADGTVIDAQGATVNLHFRPRGVETTPTTIACTPVTNGSDGKFVFSFPGTTLNVAPGAYEGEVEILFTPTFRQTVYDTLKFSVRSDFA